MAYRRLRFEVAIALRLALVLVAVAAAAWLLGTSRFRVLPAVLLAAAAAQVALLVRYVASTNRSVSRALAAWRAGDFADASVDPAGAGFDELGAALAEASAQLRARQRRSEQDGRYLAAVVAHAPVPLLAIDGGKVELLNHAARRLLGTPSVTVLGELAPFGASFVRDLVETPPGERRLTRITVDAVPQYLLVSPSVFATDGRTRRLVSLQGIQSELDARTIDAWLEMARVLAHEIMSSLTPVVSLTATAADLLGDAAQSGHDGALAEAREAIATAARRSDGLMHFVRRYRELAALPPPERASIDAADVVRTVARLLRAELTARSVALTVDVPGAALTVHADAALLEQALINLVRNAADAACEGAEPTVWLIARVTRAGKVALEVADNGPGVPADLIETIFVPFFTTKRGGSGIGLPLAQHVAHAHGGTITVGERPGGGAVFSIAI